MAIIKGTVNDYPSLPRPKALPFWWPKEEPFDPYAGYWPVPKGMGD